MALLAVLAILTIVSLSIISSLGLVMAGTRAERRRETGRHLLYTAESGLQTGMFRVSRFESPVAWLSAPDFRDLLAPGLDLRVTVESVIGQPTVFEITATASEAASDMTKTLRARVQRSSPTVVHEDLDWEIPKVFDHAYFLDNWARGWGDSVSVWGDARSNGDFDLSDGADICGDLYAHGQVHGSGAGLVSDIAHRHPGVARLAMPNLSRDFGHFEETAAAKGGHVSQDEYLRIGGVHHGSIFLEGTEEHPLVIRGPVAITGDLIIKGHVTGQGAFYVGRNIYIADNLICDHGPTLNGAGQPRPDSEDPDALSSDEDRRDWVRENLRRDLVIYAARENIFFGDVNSPDWRDSVFNPLLSQSGDESNVGPDGVPGTADDGTAFDHDWDGDGEVEHDAWCDIDGDGVRDDSYNWSEDVVLDLSNPGEWTGLPAGGEPTTYSAIADQNITRLDGVFCSDHAFAGRTHSGPLHVNGALIMRDEAIVYRDRIEVCYDERIHSDFRAPGNALAADLHLETLLPVITIKTEGAYHPTRVIAWTEDEPLPPIREGL